MMNGVNYYLLFKGDSNKGGVESSVRGFIKLEAAQTAMVESYRKLAVALNIPVASNVSGNQYTTRTKNGIRLEHHSDHFQWEIARAVPEDGGPDDRQPHRLTRYTVTIEEHIAQEFPVDACDLFHAVQSAETAYKQGVFAVQSATSNARLIMARDDETGETTEWKEF